MSNIEDMVNDAKKPGVFNIMNAVKDRAYPVDEVEVFLDESIAFRAAQLDEAISDISKNLDDRKDLNKKEIDEILSRRDEILSNKEKLIEEMGGTRYIFQITGISEGRRQDLFDKAIEKYPIEQEKNRNPFTGEVEKSDIEDPARDKYFTALLWQAYITKIVAPDGSEQSSITFEDALELRRSLPIACIGAITESIEKMRAATALFMMSVNEDFLAKS
jgi:hypothetical protein